MKLLLAHFIQFNSLAIYPMNDLAEMNSIRLDENAILLDELVDSDSLF